MAKTEHKQSYLFITLKFNYLMSQGNVENFDINLSLIPLTDLEPNGLDRRTDRHTNIYKRQTDKKNLIKTSFFLF